MSSRVLVIGDILTDIIAVHSPPLAVDSDTPARISATGGGSAANTAAWLAYAGARVDVLGAVGRDAAGDARIAELTAAGVGCGGVVRSDTAPTGSVIVLTDGRHRTMLTDRGANRELRPSDVDSALAALPDVAHLHLSGYTLLDPTSRAAGARALTAAAARGLPTSVDAASAAPLRHVGQFLEWIAGADLLLANLDEAVVLAAAAPAPAVPVAADDLHGLARALAASGGPPEVVVKLGRLGAVWARGDEVRQAPARPARAVDTTGAGDAFAAGLIAARVAGADADAALAAAVRLGALAVAHPGGRPHSRDRDVSLGPE
jgi:sugar/nucleoside kinase (ribokinase family)